jgi:hydroxymethylpyrimidine/phosphomethylpyrimidine kinase
LGAKAILLKGGHFDEQRAGKSVTDWLSLPDSEPLPMPHPRVETSNNHGTGCTLSAALASFLGFGLLLPEAAAKAQAYLGRALASSFSPGIGAGPPDFLGGAEGSGCGVYRKR